MITVAELSSHGITGDPGALELLLAAAYKDIEAKYGPVGAQTEIYNTYPSCKRVWLKQKAASITKVEHGHTLLPADLEELTANVNEGYLLERNQVVVKIHGNFDPIVRVQYMPENDEERRDRVAIDLVKLSLRYQGGLVSQKTVGDLSISYAQSGNSRSYYQERDQLIYSLSLGRRNMA